MYTKARIAGHPIHPMLIAFPIALYATTVVSLLAFIATKDYFWYRAATYANIAAVAMALVAAIPGAIDLLSIPERSKARATGLRHAGANVVALTLFAISAGILGGNWFGRHVVDGSYRFTTGAPLVLGILGLAATGLAGYFGWTLVQRHHVGVTPSHYGTVGYRRPEEVDDLDEITAELSGDTNRTVVPPMPETRAPKSSEPANAGERGPIDRH
jgi:uncharacterized membrane protein